MILELKLKNLIKKGQLTIEAKQYSMGFLMYANVKCRTTISLRPGEEKWKSLILYTSGVTSLESRL